MTTGSSPTPPHDPGSTVRRRVAIAAVALLACLTPTACDAASAGPVAAPAAARVRTIEAAGHSGHHAAAAAPTADPGAEPAGPGVAPAGSTATPDGAGDPAGDPTATTAQDSAGPAPGDPAPGEPASGDPGIGAPAAAAPGAAVPGADARSADSSSADPGAVDAGAVDPSAVDPSAVDPGAVGPTAPAAGTVPPGTVPPALVPPSVVPPAAVPPPAVVPPANPAAAPPTTNGLELLGRDCATSKLPPHTGFQIAPACVSTAFGEVASEDRSPALLITRAPRVTRANRPFSISVSTRNLVRDRFLGAAAGGYYLESSFLDPNGLQRGHFHTACRMLTSSTAAPDPAPVPAFFVATQDKGGGARPDTVRVVVTGLPRGRAQCTVWAGDGSHRVPMMQRANQTPAVDSVRITVL